MVAVPEALPFASPPELTVATDGVEEVHAHWAVIPTTDPSLNVPFAVNCCVEPLLIEEDAGVTEIDTRVALVTLSVAVPTCPWKTAEIVALPG